MKGLLKFSLHFAAFMINYHQDYGTGQIPPGYLNWKLENICQRIPWILIHSILLFLLNTCLFLSLSLLHDKIPDKVWTDVNYMWEHFHCRKPVLFIVTNLQQQQDKMLLQHVSYKIQT